MSPAGAQTGKCYRCHDPIWLAEQENGKPMAMNVWSSPKGSYYAVDPEAAKPMVHYIGKTTEVPEDARRYFPHFITCRRKKK